MRVRIGCEFAYQSPGPTSMLFMVRPREDPRQRPLDEARCVTPDVPIHDYDDAFGNRIWRLTAPAGHFRFRYDALAAVPRDPDPVLTELPGTPVEELPDEVLPFILPSRYCPSDLLVMDAAALFGESPEGWARVQAVCDWIHAHVTYAVGSDTATTALDTYLQRQGVCRDFAHLGVTFCRALNIPARYACGYLPDVGVPFDPTPMDFHAWFEAYLGGEWRTFDARHNTPRIGRILIAHGRDAVDTATMTSFGPTQLITMEVWAEEVEETLLLNPSQEQRKFHIIVKDVSR